MLHSIVLLLFAGTISTRLIPVTTDIYIGERGPYRFLVDTGAESTLIDPKLAAELNLQPAFRTEIVTLHGSHYVPGTRINTLRVGSHALGELEVLFQDVAELQRVSGDLRGVLGANALANFDYLLSPSSGRLTPAAPRPAGEVVPFRYVDGRMVVNARMGKESLALILDSGASHPVLFRTPAAMAKTASILTTMNTLEGARSAAATTWTSELVFGEHIRIGTLPAAVVQRAGTSTDGLIPASIFQKIFVDQARREIVLVR
jgi:predicted aspartyl protease